jgi:hypothetical protein
MLRRHNFVTAAAPAIALLGLAPLALARPGPAPGASRAQPTLRCDPHATREVEPLVLEEGQAASVRATFNYTCTADTSVVAFVIAVENSDRIQPPGFGGRNLTANIREGLRDFINEIDFDNGSMGGFIVYSASSQVRVELGGGSSARQSLLTAAATFPAPGSPSGRGAADAITTATAMLSGDAVPANAAKVLLVVDLGAPWGTEATVQSACTAARDAGILLSVMSVDTAEQRMEPCATEGLFRYSGRPGGDDIPEKVRALGQGFAHANQVQSAQLTDQLEQGMRYVDGSAVPEPSLVFAGEIAWDFLPPPPAGGYVVTYEVAADRPGGDLTLSVDAVLQLLYGDGTAAEVMLPNPEVCVYPRGQPDACRGFGATPSPTAPPDEPTDEAPTPTPTLEPSPEGTTWSVYLPALTRR